jgi:hypothetical protein
MQMSKYIARLRKTWRGLRGNQSGLALTEFALATPIVTTLGLYGLEAANMAIAQMRISQISANLADTASRIGETSPLSLKRIRESDINDAFEAVRLQGGAYKITTHGRVILSSLERNADDGQWIHWQRCVGKKDFPSTYGTQGDGETGTSFAGKGESGMEIQAPPASAVMFVEITYEYQPLISDSLFGNKILHSKSAFLVRDRRDLTTANNPSNIAGDAPFTCDKFEA